MAHKTLLSLACSPFPANREQDLGQRSWSGTLSSPNLLSLSSILVPCVLSPFGGRDGKSVQILQYFFPQSTTNRLERSRWISCWLEKMMGGKAGGECDRRWGSGWKGRWNMDLAVSPYLRMIAPSWVEPIALFILLPLGVATPRPGCPSVGLMNKPPAALDAHNGKVHIAQKLFLALLSSPALEHNLRAKFSRFADR